MFKGLTSFRLKHYDEALSDLMQARQRGVTGSRDIAEAARYHTAILLPATSSTEQALSVLSDFGLEGNDSPRDHRGDGAGDAAHADAARRSAGQHGASS